MPSLRWRGATNDESKPLTRIIPGAVEALQGRIPLTPKRRSWPHSLAARSECWSQPRIGAWGLNWQHCNRMTFFPSHSYEQYYQAIRRSWRFGQQRPVVVDLITTKGTAGALANMQRKPERADAMFAALISMNDAMNIQRTTDMTSTD